MSRYFVYVNTHNDKKHITVHRESSKPCPHVFKHVQSGGIYEDTFKITRLDGGTLKTAEKDNSYWLIVWTSNASDVEKDMHVVKASNDLDVSIDYCEACK